MSRQNVDYRARREQAADREHRKGRAARLLAACNGDLVQARAVARLLRVAGLK